MLDPRWWDQIFDQLSLQHQRNLGLTCKTLHGLLFKKEQQLKSENAQLYSSYLQKERRRVKKEEQLRVAKEEYKLGKLQEEKEEKKQKNKIKRGRLFLSLLLTFLLLFTIFSGLFTGPFNCLGVGNRSCFGKAIVGEIVSNYEHTDLRNVVRNCTIEFENDGETIIMYGVDEYVCYDLVIGTKHSFLKDPSTGIYNMAIESENLKQLRYDIFVVFVTFTVVGCVAMIVILVILGTLNEYCCKSCW